MEILAEDTDGHVTDHLDMEKPALTSKVGNIPYFFIRL